MSQNNNKNFIILLMFPLFLNGCISNISAKNKKVCQVADVKWVGKAKIQPGRKVVGGALVGTGTGALAGGAIGALTGIAAGAGLGAVTFGIGFLAIPALAAGGAASGAGIGAGIGAAGGGAAGLLHEHYQKAGKSVYEYTVVCGQKESFIVRQIQKQPFSISEPVYLNWGTSVLKGVKRNH